MQKNNSGKKQKTEFATKEQQKKLQEAKQLLDKKLKIVSEHIPVFERDSKTESFVKGFFVGNAIFFMLGSLAFFYGKAGQAVARFHGRSGAADKSIIYGNMSYEQAIKNAYLLEDWRNSEGGVFQGICGLLSVLISIGIGVRSIKLEKRAAEEEDTLLAESVLKDLEILKDYGVDVTALSKRLTPDIKKILESLSEIDRGYFNNLIAGGLNKADYETCVAIISGYLKSHPNEYNKILEIIDNATLPDAVKQKYGKGKTISFAAAQALQSER